MSDPIDEYGDLDETRIFKALDDHEVEYVVVGGSAAILWGAQKDQGRIVEWRSDGGAHQRVDPVRVSRERVCSGR